MPPTPDPGRVRAEAPGAREVRSPPSVYSAPMKDPRRVLLDRAADRQLRRDGYAVIPMLTPDQAASLREAYLALDAPGGDGFVPDLFSEDQEYRSQTNRILQRALDDVVISAFVAHQPFLRNFLIKHPGPESAFPPHCDWMFVDERQGPHTFAAWIALEDIEPEKGRLQVLPGSHQLPGDVRGTDLGPASLGFDEEIRERLVTVPVAVGECVVFDNAVIHASTPNTTGQRRVVAGLGMRPVDVPLVHFRRTGPSTASRYEVDEAFFQTITPQDLFTAPPRSAPVETVGLGGSAMTSEEFVRTIDGPVRRSWRAGARRRRPGRRIGPVAAG